MYDDVLLTQLGDCLRHSLPQWGFASDVSLRLLTFSENATFIVNEAEAGPVIFRVNRPGYHSPAEVRSELAWIEALRVDGVAATPRPLPMINGELVGGFENCGDWCNVAAFEFMRGDAPAPGEKLAPWFQALGTITARLHRHAQSWKPVGAFCRKTWDFDAMLGERPLWGDWRAGMGIDAAGCAVIERTTQILRARTASYGTSAGRFGLIHADLRLANLLVDGDRLGVIDFDDCGMSWFMYDFASAVSFMEHEPFIPELQAAWLEGYAAVAAVSAEDIAMIPAFVMARRILLMAWIASRSEAPAAQAMGQTYTQKTVELAEHYLTDHG